MMYFVRKNYIILEKYFVNNIKKHPYMANKNQNIVQDFQKKDINVQLNLKEILSIVVKNTVLTVAKWKILNTYLLIVKVLKLMINNNVNLVKLNL